MAELTRIFIAASGMITAVGANTEMVACSVRAGINRYQESAYYNKQRNLMKMALVPDEALPPLEINLIPQGMTSRQKRMLRLASPALHEVMKDYVEPDPVPLFLAGTESIPGRPEPFPDGFMQSLIKQTGANIDPVYSRFFATGRAGGLHAIDMAFKYFTATGKKYALVGGVDSCVDLALLHALDQEDRILAEDITDGFAPGEGAGFLLLASENLAHNKVLASLYRPGLSNEPGHRYSEKPYKGEGLADAMAKALAYGPSTKIEVIYSSLNGESFGAKELGVAMTRNHRAFSEDLMHEHPADCFGDIGAAFGPVLLGLADQLSRKRSSLVYCSSDKEYRGAILISA